MGMEIVHDIRWLLAIAGVVLLAAAILGGGIQVKEISIPKIGRGQRLLAAIAGVVLLVFALAPARKQKPTIESFQANPARIGVGEMAVLSWKVSGATQVTIDHEIGEVAGSGNVPVSPPNSTKFKLTATNGETTIAHAVIMVGSSPIPEAAKPVIQSFRARSGHIAAGQDTSLEWAVSGAASVVIEPEIGGVPLSGRRRIAPRQTTPYVLTAINQAGTSTSSVVVGVDAALPRADSPLPAPAPVPRPTPPPPLTPALIVDRSEALEVRGRSLVKYILAVTNWNSFSADMFRPAPGLPPCGLNANSSRTWVNIHNAENDRSIYGFCALSSPEQLKDLWFAVEQGRTAPQAVYVQLIDRQEGVTYRSNRVGIR